MLKLEPLPGRGKKTRRAEAIASAQSRELAGGTAVGLALRRTGVDREP